MFFVLFAALTIFLSWHYAHVYGDNARTLGWLGALSLLILLQNFTGWEDVEGWDDLSFVQRNDPFITKMAIVGDEKWRDMAYMFTLKGLRPVPIEYFASDAQRAARQWLAEAAL